MSDAALHERLRQIIARSRGADVPVSAPFRAPPLERAPEPPLDALLPGWWFESGGARAFVTDHLTRRRARVGRAPLRPPPPAALALLGRDPALADVAPERVAYLDAETTGLGSGTGVYVFLVGIGRFAPDGFHVRQVFLPAFEDEEALLDAVEHELAGVEALVTYNGRAFDVPLLETRFVLGRRRTRLAALPHADLLHATRALCRHVLPSARLIEAESGLLELRREADLPGALIPSVYFRYQRERRFRPLVPVFRHNRADIVGLAGLAAHLARRLDDGGGAATGLVAAGRWLERGGAVADARARYRRAAEDGHLEALRHAARTAERAGDLDEALRSWQALAADDSNRSVEPYERLALLHERRLRDPAAALAWTQRGLTLVERFHARFAPAQAAPIHERLERRRARLARRVERGATVPRMPRTRASGRARSP